MSGAAKRRFYLPVLGLLGVLAIIWAWPAQTRQYQVLATFAVVALFAAAMLFFASGVLSPRARRAGAGVIVAGLFVAVALVRIEGVTGDLMPVFGLRATDADASVPAVEGLTDLLHFINTPDDWLEFLGPRRDGTRTDITLEPDWTSHPPRELWRRPIGAGWGSFAVVGAVAITQEQWGEHEAVVAYTLAYGEVAWTHSHVARFDSTIAGVGPRATPSIFDQRVYAMGATGVLEALDLRTGTKIWSRNVLDDADGALQDWGKSSSPLVFDDLVVVTGSRGGPSLLAYDRHDGTPRWRAGDDGAGYSSPLLTEIEGERQIVVFNDSSLSGHVPEDGRLLWSAPWPAGEPTVAPPLVLSGNLVLASSGYGRGARLFGLTRFDDGYDVSMLWESLRLKAKFAHFIEHEGYVYGLDDGILTCIDPGNGARVWKAGRYGHGQLVLAGNHLLIQAEDGDVVLVDPSPEGLRELARLPALTSKTWNVPTLAGEYLLVRNDKQAAAYELALRDSR